MNVTKHVHVTIKLDEHETAMLQDLLSLLAEKLGLAGVDYVGPAREQFLIDLRFHLRHGTK